MKINQIWEPFFLQILVFPNTHSKSDLPLLCLRPLSRSHYSRPALSPPQSCTPSPLSRCRAISRSVWFKNKKMMIFSKVRYIKTSNYRNPAYDNLMKNKLHYKNQHETLSKPCEKQLYLCDPCVIQTLALTEIHSKSKFRIFNFWREIIYCSGWLWLHYL